MYTYIYAYVHAYNMTRHGKMGLMCSENYSTFLDFNSNNLISNLLKVIVCMLHFERNRLQFKV